MLVRGPRKAVVLQLGSASIPIPYEIKAGRPEVRMRTTGSLPVKIRLLNSQTCKRCNQWFMRQFSGAAAAAGRTDGRKPPLCLCAKVRNSAPDKRADNAQHRAAVTGSGNGARRRDGGHSRRMAWIRGKILTWVARIFAESRNLRETALRGPGNT